MPFPKRLLNSFETVKIDMRPHWWFLTPPASALVASLIFAIFSLTRGNSFGGKVLKVLAIALLVVCGGWMLRRYLKWFSTYFVVTSDRVIFREGFLRKDGIQIPLERVNNVNFHQSVFERMLGAGDLLIESGGEDGRQRFTDVKHPDRVTNVIHEAMAEHDNLARSGGQASGSAAADFTEQLERLEGLRDRGSITQEEYDAQKRKLLG